MSAPPVRGISDVVEAAEAEGSLLLSWAPGFFGDVEGVNRLIDGFRDYYGTDIDVTFTPSSGQGETATKVEQENRAGLDASTDVLGLTASGALQFAERGLLLEVDWEALSENLPTEMIVLDGQALEVQAWALGIAYHTERVGEESPRTMEDLLQPSFKGRVYTNPFGGGFDLLASESGWGRERTLDFASEFARQVGGLGFTVQPILTGEFDVMALLVPPSSALKARSEGAPIDFVIPQDAALLYQNLLSVPVNAAHPNAAKLFIAFMASPRGQEILRQVDFADSPHVEGSLTGAQIDAAREAGATFVNGNVAFYESQDRQTYEDNVEDLLDLLLDRED